MWIRKRQPLGIKQLCRMGMAYAALLMSLSAVTATLQPVPTQVWPGAQLEIELVLQSDDADDIDVADIAFLAGDGAAVQIDRRQRQQSVQIINGKVNAQLSYQGTLTVDQNANETVTLPIATVTMRSGMSVSTLPEEITVAKPDPTLVGESVAKISWPEGPIAPGQRMPITISGFVPLERYNRSNSPALNRQSTIINERLPFISQDFEQKVNLALGADGSRWVGISWTSDIIPQQPGAYPLSAEVLIVRGRRIQETVTTLPITLNVNDFPTAGRPSDFTGVVGPLSIDAELSHDRCVTGEGVILSITVLGENARLIQNPIPQLPRSVELHELPTDEFVTNVDNKEVNGIRFQYDLVPQESGKITIPPLGISWFNATTQSYESASTAPLLLSVFPGRGGNTANTAGSTTYQERYSLVLTPVTGTSQRQISSVFWAGGIGLIIVLAAWLMQFISKRRQQPRDDLLLIQRAAKDKNWQQCERLFLLRQQNGAEVPHELVHALGAIRWHRASDQAFTDHLQRWLASQPAATAIAHTTNQEVER